MLCENVKDIPGYEGIYAITTDGRIYSHSRVMKHPHKVEGVLIKGRWLKLYSNKKGYVSVHLSKDGVGKSFLVHRLVAEVFIPNTDNKPHINHINAIKTDNNIENLEWVTHKENMEHMYANNLRDNTKLAGVANGSSKLTEEQVLSIRDDKRSGPVIAEEFGLSVSTVNRIKSKKLWRHL